MTLALLPPRPSSRAMASVRGRSLTRGRGAGILCSSMALTKRDAHEGLQAGSKQLATRAVPSQEEWREALDRFRSASENEGNAEAWEGLAQAAWWLQDLATLFPAREKAFQLYSTSGDRLGAARVATALGNDYFDFRGEHAVANGWLRRAKSLLEGLPASEEQAWLAIWEARLALMARRDSQSAKELCGKARELGLRLGFGQVEPLALALSGLALLSEGEALEGMSQLDEASAAALGGATGDPLAVGLTCCYLIGACEQVGDFERAAQWCQRLEEFCNRTEFTSLLTNCRLQYGTVLTIQGQWEEADRQLRAAAADMERWRPALLPGALARLGELRRRQERLEEASHLFERAGNHPIALLGAARIDMGRGNRQGARDLIQLFLRRLPAAATIQRVPGLELLLRLELQEGGTERARQVLLELQAATESLDAPASRAAYLAALAEITRAEGAATAWLEQLEDAADLYAQAGMPLEEAHCRLRLGSDLLALGRLDSAMRAARRAQSLFGELQAASGLAETRRLLGRADTEASKRREGALTVREREVLRLVASGLSDREIAQRLDLSAHTVHRHLANIRARLAVGSRAAAVAKAMAEDLL